MIFLILIMYPLLIAVLASLFHRYGAAITFAGALGTFVLSIYSALAVNSASDHLLVIFPNWIALDSLGAVVLLLIAFVYATAALFSTGYMNFKKTGGSRLYYLNFNLFVFSMLIIPFIQEPNMVWVAVELTTIFSVLLVGFANTRESLEAAWKYVVLTLMGAAIALFGFLMLFWAARQAGVEHFTWLGLAASAPSMSPVLLQAAFVLIFIGFGAKVGFVPLHTWLPDAHSQAPTPVCALLSGVETTAVLYTLLRIFPIMRAAPVPYVDTLLLVFGLISVGTAAFLLIQVRDYKRLFAFSTVEHMGIILAAVGIGGTAAHVAAILQIIAHAVTKSFCFYAAGSVLLLFGNRDISSVRNLIRESPAAAAALFLGGLAIAGAPPFALFLSEFSIIQSGLGKGEYIAMGLLVLFIAIAFFAIMNHISRMVFGTQEIAVHENSVILSKRCKAALVVAAVPVFILGIYIPAAFMKLIINAATVIGG